MGILVCLPYAWHIFMIGVGKTSAVMMQPYLADVLQQKDPDDARQTLVLQLVEYLQGVDQGTTWIGDGLHHWLSPAR